MARTIDTLPAYLRQYCIEHDPSKYTSRDHAAWRYIMRRAIPFFRKHAVQGYEEGLAATALPIDRIPNIDDVDQALQNFGWGAVPVCGFIPPWAFLEFQARSILPIATDMRSVDHIAYTPAPDIVHEAAGHAPILPDKDYREYLAYYAKLGTKAIYSKQDLNLYEAVRYLSDIKEKPESSKEQIAEAEKRLDAAVRSFTYVSEAAKVGRMSWWTAEYGLVGSLEQPKIYGAGLLSSVGESEQAMTSRVRKIPLSLACTEQGFNITEPQPQLYVAESMQHLHDVLHELDETLAYRIGGIAALRKGQEAEAITTAVLDSEIAVSGILSDFLVEQYEPIFLRYNGPVQLSYHENQLSGHGPVRHPSGFSSPIGRWACLPEKSPHLISDQELKERCGIVTGKSVRLRMCSGVEVSGQVKSTLRQDGKLMMITFVDCTVTYNQQHLFEPHWGEFDMLVGEKVVSVYGGPADREQFGDLEIAKASTTPGRDSPYGPEEHQLFDLYQQIRDLREDDQRADRFEQTRNLSRLALDRHPSEWLLLLELFELGQKHLGLAKDEHKWLDDLHDHLNKPGNVFTSDQRELIDHGLQVLS
ncbi:MAG: aromatic amino acid hydroxylase [Oligoflexus sp.]